MTHVDGFGHSRAARGVDVKRAIVDGDVAQRPGFERRAPRGFRSVRRCRGIRRESTPAAAREVRQGSVECLGELHGDDDVFGRSRLNAVREGLPGEVGVEQRDDPAHAGDTQPDGEIIGAVGHQQADHVAFPHALCEGPTGVPAHRPASSR